ncbi:hypothetical protein M408DRAFT_328625 [Serendipita vermifera MAFF 305830]|uniref:Amine oxidase domain-containing protein n=1 Tax=Serendipita vermifera MAFF 305830 TaxID=933852 RepID=A0A0C3AZ55_SERVB|nr:hypothetical protein M408DRAFT_328625 [Serendipita vermifera MAFF 305830]
MATTMDVNNNNQSEEYDVIIVGAGMAGLSAAYRILTQRPSTKLLILEARERVGGRIWSIPFDKKKFGLEDTLEGGRSIDLGASFIHGVLGNPLIPLAKKIGLPVKRTANPTEPNSAMRAFTADGKLVPPEETGELAGRVFGTIFGWLPAFAQGDDGSTTVVPETMSVKDGILAEGSPIYDGEPKPADGVAMDEHLRTALMLSRSFQGWTGAPIDYVSLKWWGFNQDTEGGDGILVRGYGEMVDGLKAEIERLGGVFRLKAPVAAVELVEGEEEEEGSVKITTRRVEEMPAVMHAELSSIFQAPYTLLTLPLGVLKHAPPTFTPPLSIRRQQAIQRLGMGLLDKIVLIYEKAWWADTRSSSAMINILIPSEDDPTRLLGPTGGRVSSHGMAKGAFPPRTPEWLEQNPQALMAFDLHAQCGIPALCVFVAGEFGDVAETCTDAQTTEWVTGVVRQWLGGLMKKATDENGDTKTEVGVVPRPVEVLRTAWRKDEHAFGSYAYIPVGSESESPSASPLDQVELTRTMWDRCFWAGEHTELNQYASVHAAWTSGIREAEKILVRLEGMSV